MPTSPLQTISKGSSLGGATEVSTADPHGLNPGRNPDEMPGLIVESADVAKLGFEAVYPTRA
jgi:hypothetical protein